MDNKILYRYLIDIDKGDIDPRLLQKSLVMSSDHIMPNAPRPIPNVQPLNMEVYDVKGIFLGSNSNVHSSNILKQVTENEH